MVSFLSIYQEEVLQDQDVTDLCSKLKWQSNHYWNAKRHVRDEIAKRDIHNLSDVSKVIPTCLQQSSVASEVARFSWHILQEFRDWTSTARFVFHPEYTIPPIPCELHRFHELDCITLVRETWSQKILTDLRTLSKEQNQPFSRPAEDDIDLGPDDEPAQTRHVVDISDLYNVVLKKIIPKSCLFAKISLKNQFFFYRNSKISF